MLIHPAISIIYTLVSAILAVLAMLLWQMPSDHKSNNRTLSLILLVCVLDGLYFGQYLANPDFALQYPGLYGFQSLSIYVIFPGFYLYVRHMLMGSKDKASIWPHFILFFAIAFILRPLIFSDIDVKKRLLERLIRGEDMHISELGLSESLQALVVLSQLVILGIIPFYCLKMATAYRQHISAIEEVISDYSQVKLVWIKHIITVCVIYWLILAGALAMVYLIQDRYTAYIMHIYLGANSFLFLFIALMGVKHPYIYAKYLKTQLEDYIKESSNQKYRDSALSDDEAEKIKIKLIAAMEVDKLYLDNTLTVKKLSDAIGLSRQQVVSEVLSTKLGENFYQFVNRHRAQQAKKMLESNPLANSMLKLATDCGFSSLATFNRRFKEATGMNPTQYQKKVTRKEEQ